MSSPAAEQNSRIASTISREREAARQQLSAAWQLQVFRVEEALATGWQEHIARVFEEHFTELAARIEREFADTVRQSAEEINRAVRRFATWEGQEQWAAALLDSVRGFCSRAALFLVEPHSLHGLRALAGLDVPLEEASAVAAAIASRDTLVTLATAGELSSGIADLFEAGRCAILPVVARERVAAVLLAAGEPIEIDGLEAMTALAGAALKRRGRTAPLPETVQSPAEEALFLRAQRFARVRAAEIRLSKQREVVEGRAARRLYALLKEEIDAARLDYAREFLQASPSMPDYLHAELIRTLANEDTAALGEEYPGPLA
jgi:hypothetical protein